MLNNIEALSEEIRSRLEAKDRAREEAIKLAREVIRYSGQSVKAIHRREFEITMERLRMARVKLTELGEVLDPYPDLKINLARDAEKRVCRGGHHLLHPL